MIRVKQKLIDNTGLRLVQVVATDKGTPPLNSSYDLSVFVIDENQHKPIFVQPNQTIYETEKIPEIWVEEVRVIKSAGTHFFVGHVMCLCECSVLFVSVYVFSCVNINVCVCFHV